MTISGTDNWHSWKKKYGKVYSNPKEELYRRTIWQKNLLYVRNHNEKSDKEFLLHINQFADANMHILNRNSKSHSFESVRKEIKAPKSFDWRSKGVIGPVHDQGRLFNVKAIVASESVASLHAIQTGQLFDLSAYEIDDCGCGMQLFIKDIFGCIKRKIGGLCTNVTYHHQDQICNKDTCTPIAMVNGTGFIPEGDEDAMLEAILKTPLMVAMDASQPSFELYQAGIYSDTKCSPDHLSHIMQVVGYGEQNGRKYWICRNSWGKDWGNQGYVWVERGTNMCGIASFAIFPY
ncbi:hypothetical protein LOTGIDRAFT_172091 [Lottia gigantea]|uniref:Peptidase C1A papain C-terminal domain-containing protein n=1 Tax=Lottia gigantea TaxID=225164 RepID=V4AEK4_LOTGI|nr:hypothetical protein LOTGIDRAFT_172091 [Lottia gigantea]ESP02434.1 hypothetical protein LOTGIDRAFT_172091 [Lottia gigantea]